jgi:cytidyltransferase-like protein
MNSVGTKIVTLDQLLAKELPRPLGFCWGGFDFIHAGHLLHFDFARKMSATLVVGINSDEAFPNKGKGRPVFPETMRAYLLSLVGIIDYVTVYHGPFADPDASTGILHGTVQSTPFIPLDIIRRLRPDLYFKGIEYEGKIIPEKEIVEQCGGRVVYGPKEPVFSSSQILRQMGS